MPKQQPAEAPDQGATVFEATPEEQAELLDAIRGVDRGEVITAEELLERLRR